MSGNLKSLAEDLSIFNYVVQRNWENLPVSYVVDGHNDLDLFTTDMARAEIELIVRGHGIPCDVRSPIDNYYPKYISDMLLEDSIEFNGFYIPTQKAAFFALYYHNAVHKTGDPYGERLRKMFLKWIPPVRCADEGVEFHDLD